MSESLVGESDLLKERLVEALLKVIDRRIATEGPVRASLLSVSWLDPELVAEAAELPPRMIEELWPGQNRYNGTDISAFEALVLEAFDSNRVEHISSNAQIAIAAGAGDFEEVIRLGVPASVDSFLKIERARDWLQFRLSIAASLYGMYERAGYGTFIVEIGELYGILLYQVGRKLKPGITVEDLVVSIGSIIEGVWFRVSYGFPDTDPVVKWRPTPTSPEREWSVAAIAVWGITSVMTESR